jgi:hypothetical protein
MSDNHPINNDEPKKEFWIYKGNSCHFDDLEFDHETDSYLKKKPDTFYDAVSFTDTIEGGIHVIEYSAYEAEKKKVDKLLEAIKFYADPNNWNSDDKGVGDRINFSDVDTKPVQGDYDLSSPSGGRIAREVLRKLRNEDNNVG